LLIRSDASELEKVAALLGNDSTKQPKKEATVIKLN
jgi:hypothetical protein